MAGTMETPGGEMPVDRFHGCMFRRPSPPEFDLQTLTSSLIKENVTKSWLEGAQQKGKKYQGIAESVLDEFLRGLPPCS